LLDPPHRRPFGSAASPVSLLQCNNWRPGGVRPSVCRAWSSSNWAGADTSSTCCRAPSWARSACPAPPGARWVGVRRTIGWPGPTSIPFVIPGRPGCDATAAWTPRDWLRPKAGATSAVQGNVIPAADKPAIYGHFSHLSLIFPRSRPHLFCKILTRRDLPFVEEDLVP